MVSLHNAALEPADPSWRAMVARAVDEPRILSSPYRLGAEGPALAARLASILRAAFGPARLIFGTDWPHTRFEGPERAASALDELGQWLPVAGDRSSCLGDAPRGLFAFDVPHGSDEGEGANSPPVQGKV